MAPEQCDNRAIDAPHRHLCARRHGLPARHRAAPLHGHEHRPAAARPPPRAASAAARGEPAACPRRSRSPSSARSRSDPRTATRTWRAFGRALFAVEEALARPGSPVAVAAPPAAAPAPERVPPPPAGPPKAPPGLAVEVRLPGEATARSLEATELTRAGVYVRASPPLPPPMTRLKVSLTVDGGAARARGGGGPGRHPGGGEGLEDGTRLRAAVPRALGPGAVRAREARRPERAPPSSRPRPLRRRGRGLAARRHAGARRRDPLRAPRGLAGRRAEGRAEPGPLAEGPARAAARPQAVRAPRRHGGPDARPGRAWRPT